MRRNGRTRLRRQRRRPSKKSYSLAHLLAQQPKSLRRSEHYSAMLEHFHSSARLQNLRISRRCYSLLHHARIEPQNLHHFYRTYRLPKDPFFPLFFRIKRDYLIERERRKEERRQYVLAKLRSLPGPILGFIKYLGHLEQHYNSRGRYPIWEKNLFPSSKKMANAYCRYGVLQWLRTFRRHLSLLAERYPGLDGETTERLLACFVLECVPDGQEPPGSLRWPPTWPDDAEVQRNYRRLSLRHHPDRGGDARVFVELKHARDVLRRAR